MEMPEDVSMEILSRVPVKSLLRFKSVSKYWYSLIRNPTFISLHHNRVQSNDCLVVARQRVFRGQLKDDSVFSMYLPPDQTSSSPFQQLDLSSSGILHDGVVKAVFLLGCHNGLMCLAHDITSSIVIFNPATRESRLLPQPLYESKHRSFLGFTFDSKANDYKVIRFCSSFEFMPFIAFDEDHPSHNARFKYNNYRGDQKVQIYHLSTDSWRETDAIVPKDFPDCSECDCCTSLDGVFYWAGLDHGTGVSVIRAFHTFEELFERIPLPDSMCFGLMTQLRVLHDSLALVLSKWDYPRWETSVDIWLMNEYGVDKSWTKSYSIGPLSEYYNVLGFRQNVEVLLSHVDPNNGEMVSYNLNTHEIKEYNQLCNLYNILVELGPKAMHVFQYAESLISVKR